MQKISLLKSLKLGTHYPCPRAVFTVDTGVQNVARDHGRPVNTV